MRQIIEARTDLEFDAARSLFQEYAAEIKIDLEFQNFSSELDNIREMYRAPGGCLLLARDASRIVGCVGLRPFETDTCEMKRLYVQPSARHANVGRRLAVAVIERARAAGYRRMVLDTLASMHAALRLYRSLGFRDTPAYYGNPLEDAVYLELLLTEE
jgi:ribosomal protein S18 acetylase RimI-like enzyme